MDRRDRVRENTPAEINTRIDSGTEASVRGYAASGLHEIAARIAELDREWDVERVLEKNAAALALAGLTLGATRARRWLLLPAIVLSFLLQHALQGWCPPIAIIRRLGVRTRREIDRDRVALKALRGDFGLVMGGSTPQERAKLELSAAGDWLRTGTGCAPGRRRVLSPRARRSRSARPGLAAGACR